MNKYLIFHLYMHNSTKQFYNINLELANPLATKYELAIRQPTRKGNFDPSIKIISQPNVNQSWRNFIFR